MTNTLGLGSRRNAVFPFGTDRILEKGKYSNRIDAPIGGSGVGWVVALMRVSNAEDMNERLGDFCETPLK